MDPRVQSISTIMTLNTRLLHNCLAGVDDTLANQRVVSGSNTLAFLAAHLTDSRHYLCKQAGHGFPHPLGQALEHATTLEEVEPLPAIAAIAAAWDTVAGHLTRMLEELDEAALARPGFRFPGTDGTLLGMLAFLAQHESYHVGQMSMLRKQLGLAAMSYRTNKD